MVLLGQREIDPSIQAIQFQSSSPMMASELPLVGPCITMARFDSPTNPNLDPHQALILVDAHPFTLKLGQ